jgi:hypothetical protein
MGVLVDACRRAARSACRRGRRYPLHGTQAFGPFHDAVSSNLGQRVTGWLHERLLDACDGPRGLAHLEDPDVARDVAAAREFDAGITGPPITICMPAVGGGFAALAGGLAQRCSSPGWRWWAPIVVGRRVALDAPLPREGRHLAGAQRAGRRRAAAGGDYAYRLAVDPPGAKEVRLFGLADWIVGGFVSLRRQLLDQSWAERRTRGRPTWTAIGLIVAANALFFGLLAADAIAGRVSLGWLVVYAQAAIGASALAFSELDWWFRTAAQPVPLVLGLAGRMAASPGNLRSGTRPAAGLPAREIRFEGVRFAYPHAAGPCSTASTSRSRRASLAIVGQNGAGKTTLAKLLCRLYDPDAGAVRVDGVDLRELDLDAWRARIAAVFQDYVRYELSLRDNVAPAGASDDDVRAALELAHATRVAPLETTLSRAYEGGTDSFGRAVAARRARPRALRGRLGAGRRDPRRADRAARRRAARPRSSIADRGDAGCTTILVSHRFSDGAPRGPHLRARARPRRRARHARRADGARRPLRTMFDLQAQRFDGADEGPSGWRRR